MRSGVVVGTWLMARCESHLSVRRTGRMNFGIWGMMFGTSDWRE